MIRLNFVFPLVLIIPIITSAQFYNVDVEASIDLEVSDDNRIEISGLAHNKTKIDKSLRYVLSVIKTDADDNKTKSDQENRFVLGANDKKKLSSTTINVTDKNRTIILLLLFEGDKIVAKSRKVLNGLEGEEDEVKNTEESELTVQDVKQGNDDGFILRGMVIEETKTKAGNDFYDLFYSMYLSKNIDGEKIVRIKEELAIANNTKINILIGDQLVSQFIVNPRSQYLEQMAENTIFRVISYFEQLKKTKNQIIRY